MKKKPVFLAAVFLTAIALAGAVPQLPHSFYGHVSLQNPGEGDAQAFQSGTVSARVDGEQVASLDYEDGTYGGSGVYDSKLLVQGDSVGDGDTITFYVNGLKTENTTSFSSGEVEEFDLMVEVPPKDEPAEVSQVKQNVGEGDTVDVEVPDAATRSNGGATSINITVNQSSSSVEVNVTVSDSQTGEASSDTADTEVHGYIDINTNVGKSVESSTIGFKLNKTVVDNNGGPSAVVLLHYENGRLTEKLDATQVKENSDYYFFESQVSGFSTFAMSTDNSDPNADIDASSTDVEVDDSIDFDASGSSDNVGITSYSWDFDDGDTASGETASHSYDSAGTYTVELTVEDKAGNTDTDTVEIDVDDGVTQTIQEETDTGAAGTTDEESEEQDETQQDGQQQNETQQEPEEQQEDQQENETSGQPPEQQQQTPGRGPVGAFFQSGTNIVLSIALLLLLIVAYLEYSGRTQLVETLRSIRQSEDETFTEYSYDS